MANTQTVAVLQNPDLTIPAGATGTTGVTKGIQNSLINNVTAPTAQQILQFPGALAVINVRYWRKNQQLTGDYIISSAAGSTTTVVTTVITNSNGLLQAVNMLIGNIDTGKRDPLWASTGTVHGVCNALIDEVLAASASQIVAFPNAVTQIKRRYWSNSSQDTGTMLVTQAVAAVISAS